MSSYTFPRNTTPAEDDDIRLTMSDAETANVDLCRLLSVVERLDDTITEQAEKSQRLERDADATRESLEKDIRAKDERITELESELAREKQEFADYRAEH